MDSLQPSIIHISMFGMRYSDLFFCEGKQKNWIYGALQIYNDEAYIKWLVSNKNSDNTLRL